MKCALCHSESTFSFLDLGKQPLANKYPTKEQFVSEDFFPLSVFFCNACKNVQLGTVISRERMFEDYYYLSSVNPGLVRHFETWAKDLASAKFVVDIGSNDGILLKPLKALGVKCLGVDPSVNVSKIANDAGLPTIVAFFDSPTAKKIKQEYGAPDVAVASSIFTHLEDPHSFIEAVKDVLAPQGAFIIEVEYIGNILRDVQFERFYLDRIFYYSLSSLQKLFDLHGMKVSDVEEITPHGGSLRVTAHRNNEGPTPTERVSSLLAREEKELTPEKLRAFRARVEENISAFRQKLESYKRDHVKVAGYGSPARVATICNYGNIGPSLIDFIVDDSPLKQNKYTPGTHIPIVPKIHLEQASPDVLVVFAHEYLDDIREKTREKKYRYLLPIPPREV
jgi:SAM-dependent methyltransferase